MGIADWSALALSNHLGQQRYDEAQSAVKRDLDETRRLLYMALVVNRTKRYNLAGSLINALLHHDEPAGDEADVIERVVDAINGETDGDLDWVHAQIDRITSKLTPSESTGQEV